LEARTWQILFAVSSGICHKGVFRMNLDESHIF